MFLLPARLRGNRDFCTRAHLRNLALHFFQNFLKFPLDFQKFFPFFELKAKDFLLAAPDWWELSLGGTFASFVYTIEPLAALFSSISSIF